jgi:subtilisin family serine protease
MEIAKNPGLGVRSLHAQGLTGKGVTVAIIDQNIFLDHPEFAGKVIKYKTFGEADRGMGSMHGPAVLSLLAGTITGTAPDATVFFAAADSWTGDAKTQANALLWIISENSLLPKDKKIRAVSISAAPSGPGSPFTKNNSDWDSARAQAEREGIIVLDCTSDHGKTAACYYNYTNPDSLGGCTLGYPDYPAKVQTTRLYVPTSFRTTAETYHSGKYEYQYTGQGGLSWSIPYLTGILALGWQIRPELTGDEMIGIAFSSAYLKDGGKIINPTAFIDSVRSYHR